MKIAIYKDGHYAGEKEVPDEIIDMAMRLGRWMEMNDCTQCTGIGPVFGLQRQLAEVTKERDQLRAMLNLADALRNRERNTEASCDHGPWGHNAGYDVCLRCGHRDENDDVI